MSGGKKLPLFFLQIILVLIIQWAIRSKEDTLYEKLVYHHFWTALMVVPEEKSQKVCLGVILTMGNSSTLKPSL